MGPQHQPDCPQTSRAGSSPWRAQRPIPGPRRGGHWYPIEGLKTENSSKGPRVTAPGRKSLQQPSQSLGPEIPFPAGATPRYPQVWRNMAPLTGKSVSVCNRVASWGNHPKTPAVAENDALTTSRRCACLARTVAPHVMGLLSGGGPTGAMG